MRVSLPTTLVLLLAVGALLASAQVTDVDPEEFPYLTQELEDMIDWTKDPCDNFWEFACGGWINSNTLPGDKSSLTRSFTMIGDHNQEILKDVVTNSEHAKLNTFYESCMDTDALDNLGAKPVKSYLDRISQGTTDINSVMALAGEFALEGLPIFVNFGATQDSEVPDNTIAGFYQGGLGLPYPSLYTDPKSADTRKEYQSFLASLFEATGLTASVSSVMAKKAFALENKIAQFTLPNDQLVDPFKTYNPMSVSDFLKLSPLPWKTFFDAINVFPQGNVTLDVPRFYSNLTVALESSSSLWEAYFSANLLRAKSPLLSKEFREAHFNFYSKYIGGQQEPSPRWRQCIAATDSSLGELLGEYYAEVAFPGKSQTDAVSLLNGILEAMKTDINEISWMDSITRRRALTKLSLVTHQIGKPADPLTYESVYVSTSYFDNIVNSNKFQVSNDFARIDQPTDKSVWEMTADQVNAYYQPTLNLILFPAGILQQPFYNASFPIEMNVGGIGMVMGHELTHGFDNQGRLYNGDGKLTNWWEPATSKKFDEKVQCIIDQYSKFQPIPGVYVNGELTQGENVADNGGIHNAYRSANALIGDQWNAPSILNNPGKELTRGQLFFVSFAGGWCTVASDNYYKLHTATDPHSPPMFRVLGPLMNLEAFSQTYQCEVGSKMNPTDKCVVW
eukprot:TRINITY_DN2381_c0_g1_i1.p1 TRINITY_DN2381_c0_g1~~TRINITY_DN2381_c0_g1_i1.p1  ORF type:complete len:677 (-),score=176.62 TRINITY_DN2381_c0_g1_i1:171-2201(-)